MSSLNLKFAEMKNFHFSIGQKLKGFIIICRIQRPSMYLKICWELLTTFVFYSPSVNNYLKDIIVSIRKKWNSFSVKEQENVIAALSSLNKHGEIERTLNLQ